MKHDLCIPSLRIGGLADVGISRDHQEDCIGYADLYNRITYSSLAQKRGNLYVLADGAGGHGAGDIASEIAVLGTLTFFYREVEAGIEQALVEAIEQANHRIGEYNTNAGTSARTTLVCVVIRGNDLYAANVGDSRAYLIRDGQATQLSQDHTLVAKWIRQGKITVEQAKEHPQRHVITQALGSEATSSSIYWEEILPGDEIVLCSDGLHGMVDDYTIAQVVSRAITPQIACEQLVDLANEAEGSDNISVIIIRVEQLDDQESERPFDEKNPLLLPVFERQKNGIITLRPDKMKTSKHQGEQRHGLLAKLSSIFKR